MYVELKAYFRVGPIELEPGRYLASLESDMQRIRLSGRGVTHVLPAMSRPCKRKIRISEMSFQPSLGADEFILMFKVPPQKEWFCLLQRLHGHKLKG